MRSLLLIAIVLTAIGPAHAEIVRCSGVATGTPADPFDFEASVEMVLPEPGDYDKTLTMVQGEHSHAEAQQYLEFDRLLSQEPTPHNREGRSL